MGHSACPNKGYDWLERNSETQTLPDHRQGIPVGLHKPFNELLKKQMDLSGDLRYGPNNGLGLNYLGLAVERVKNWRTNDERPTMTGLLGDNGTPSWNQAHLEHYCGYLKRRIA